MYRTAIPPALAAQLAAHVRLAEVVPHALAIRAVASLACSMAGAAATDTGGQTAWEPVIRNSRREQTLEVIHRIAERLRDPERVETLSQLAIAQSNAPVSQQWIPWSVSYGPLGTALLFGQFDQCFPDQGWDHVAHDHLTVATRSLEHIACDTLPISLFSGLAGFCLTVDLLSRGGTRYQRLLETLDTCLTYRVTQTVQALQMSGGGVRFGDYDVISGLTGAGRQLLARAETSNDPAMAPALDLAISYLLGIGGMPRYALGYTISPENMPTDDHRLRYPDGCVDCGLAHGVPGPLGFLALSLRGARSHHRALAGEVRALATWIISQSRSDQWGINWPNAVVPANQETQEASRSAWCYGAPGIASALWLAAEALDDQSIRDIAVEGIEAVIRRPVEVRGIPSPILCHGVAGLLQITLRFAHRVNSEFLAIAADALVAELLDLYNPKSAIGFRDIQPGPAYIDSPGFLDGNVGICLSLLAAATDCDPRWDRMLLLS